MIDFTLTNLSYGALAYCVIFYIIIFLSYRNDCVILYNPTSKYRIQLLYIAFFVFSITSFTNGDFYGYQSIVWYHDGFVQGIGHEPIYDYIIVFVHNNYLLFRCIVWGSAQIAMMMAFRSFGVNTYRAMIFTFLVYITIFDYARATLGMAVYFWGLSYLIDSQNKKLSTIILGIALVLSSYELHHSMLILIGLTPLVFMPVNKKTIAILILVTIGLGIIFNAFFDAFSSMLALSDNEYLSQKADMYSSADRKINTSNIMGMITTYWKYLAFYVPYFLSSFSLYPQLSNKDLSVSSTIKGLFMISGMILVLSFFLLIIDTGSSAMFYRVLNMAFIPITALVCLTYEEGLMSVKYFKISLYWGASFLLYGFTRWLVYGDNLDIAHD